MIDTKTIVWLIGGLWIVIAAVVIGYPLSRAGRDIVSREDDSQAFWKAYTFSTALFIGISVVAGIILYSVLMGAYPVKA